MQKKDSFTRYITIIQVLHGNTKKKTLHVSKNVFVLQLTNTGKCIVHTRVPYTAMEAIGFSPLVHSLSLEKFYCNCMHSNVGEWP